MDDEELGSTGKKITINNFFESIKSVDKISQRALKFSKKSTEELKVATETLKGLQAIVQSLQIDVESLKESEQIRKNEEEDRRFKEEDAQQKKEMIERAEAVKGEKGEKGEEGEEGEKGEDGSQEEPKKAPQDKGLLNTLFGGLVGVGAMGLGALGKILNPFGSRKVNKTRNRDLLTKTTDKDTPVTSFAKKGGVAGFLNRKLFGGGKDKESEEKKEIKNEIKSEIKQELNLKDDKKGVSVDKKDGLFSGLSNFVGNVKKKISNFDGTPGSRVTKNKPQEVGATNPESEGKGGEDTSYSESSNYKGRLDPATLEFIPDEGSLPPGVPLEKAQQDVYKSKIAIEEFGFREDIMRGGMTREQAIESYGPQSNLYRFKENYNKTLEFGGYELDVGKHYDSIKNSYSGKKKGKGQDSSLKGEKRGFKGVVGGVADSLTGGFFNFDKKGNTKLQDFAQGTADTLTGGIFDFDEKGDSKIQRVGKGFIDALSGNVLDFDKKGGKPSGVMRNLTGMADFFTANMFDLDQRGSLFGDKKKKAKPLENEIESYSREQELDTNFDLNTGKAYVNGVEVDPQAYAEFKSLSEKEQLDQAGAFVIENRVNKIKPVIESDQKDLSNNIYQEINDTKVAVAESLANTAQNEISAQNQDSGFTGNTTEPQVADAEVKTSKPNIPFIDLLKNKTKKEFALSSDGSGGYIS